jgi:hypothetical protein
MNMNSLGDYPKTSIEYGNTPKLGAPLRGIIEYLLEIKKFCDEQLKERRSVGDRDGMCWFAGESAGIRRTLYTLGFVAKPEAEITQTVNKDGEPMTLIGNAPPKITIDETTF